MEYEDDVQRNEQAQEVQAVLQTIHDPEDAGKDLATFPQRAKMDY